jgi:anti-sigma B factor antagonist
MNVQVERTENGVRVMLAGELSIYTAAETKAALADAMGEADEIEVDLAGVSEIDTAGLQLMLIIKRNPGKTVRFINHPPSVLRLVDLANLGSALGDPMFIAATESGGANHE